MSNRDNWQWLGILLVPLVALAAVTCAPPPETTGGGEMAQPAAAAPYVVISSTKAIDVAGKTYGPANTHVVTDVDWSDPTPQRKGLWVEPEGGVGTVVSMGKAMGIRSIYVGEAAMEDGTLTIVTGSYSALPSAPAGASILPIGEILAKTWECIWCAEEEIMVCGVEPQCGSPGDSIP